MALEISDIGSRYVPELATACMWAIVAIGVALGLAVHRRLRTMGLGLALVFVFAADAKLVWARYLVLLALRQMDLAKGVPTSMTWYVTWKVLPVILFAVAAWVIWQDARKLSAGPAGWARNMGAHP